MALTELSILMPRQKCDTNSMAPGTRVNKDARQNAEQESSTGGDVESGSAFEQLAKAHWTKKSTKVKVKPDVLKNEIWDVLEKEDFAFSSLLALENLQILE
ncbi:unnamed protein product, partial [Diplocarpon coronariae]